MTVHSGSSQTRTRASRATTSTRKKGRGRTALAYRGPARQLAPTADRYREIQKALADRGYLKSEPNGVWDSASQDAMRTFQTDQKLDPTGKINAPSLIGLGLGPKHELPAAAATSSASAAEPPAAREPTSEP